MLNVRTAIVKCGCTNQYGKSFCVDLGNNEGSGILIEETEYALLLNGSEKEFQDGIADIDKDAGLWQELFDRYLREKEDSGYL